ncbi:serine/threonine protein kinase (plasmid) [Embleya sp. NBC_00888]|uniref:serine/threonine-protein kinase n=1 Tax=Embleya sp. NBC_00888 TaxID=2975960 RepID=UPI002F911639|nr:serine/threonine protein kinase [Embleya sp. NBC_00888]
MRDQLLGGRYRLVRQLGEGGMGQVWEAQDESLDRRVAVKVISMLAGGGSHGTEARARFLREARITARLQHPNIVTIHDLGETDTEGARAPFLVMELIRGEGLDAMLRRGGVTLPEVARWGAQICDALADAHEAGILHRDIKPSNILVTRSGIVKVLDFGVARAADPYATADRLTRTGFIVGTPAYMAPEQARGFPEPRSDLYALGCLIFELITGRLPFRAPDTVGHLSAHLTEEPPAPGSVAAGVPSAWDDLVLTLLRKDPDERYPTAADLSRALRHLDHAPEPVPTTHEFAPPATAPRTAPLPPAVSTVGVSRKPPAVSSRTATPTTVPTATPTAVSTNTWTRLGSSPDSGNDATPERVTGGAAAAAVVLAVLCLPGLLFMIFKFNEFLRPGTGAPSGVIRANMVVAIVEVVVLAAGALSLFRRHAAGRRMIAITGGVVAVQGLSGSAQYLMTGGRLTMDAPPAVLVFVVAPLTAVVGVAAMAAALRPSTRDWCLPRSQGGSSISQR